MSSSCRPYLVPVSGIYIFCIYAHKGCASFIINMDSICSPWCPWKCPGYILLQVVYIADNTITLLWYIVHHLGNKTLSDHLELWSFAWEVPKTYSLLLKLHWCCEVCHFFNSGWTQVKTASCYLAISVCNIQYIIWIMVHGVFNIIIYIINITFYILSPEARGSLQ